MRAFVSYNVEDGEFVRRLVKDLIQAGIIVYLDQRSFISGTEWQAQARQLIEQCDIFLIVLSNNSVISVEEDTEEPTAEISPDVRQENNTFDHKQKSISSKINPPKTRLTPAIQLELDYALARQAKSRAFLESDNIGLATPRIIPLLIYGDNVPSQLLNINYQDFRDIARYQHEFDRLLTAMGLPLSAVEKKELHYRIAVLDPHPAEVVRLQSHIFAAVEKAISPVKDQIQEIVHAQRQQSWIMSTEMIAVMEVQAKSEIWVVTTHLWNDVHDETIRESVKRNMQRGIRYRYFVRNNPHMQSRINEYQKHYGASIPKKRDYQFICLKDKDLLMPFDEVVIYDGLDDLKRWGYAQLTYREHSVFIKLGERNVMAMFNQLEHRLHQKPAVTTK